MIQVEPEQLNLYYNFALRYSGFLKFEEYVVHFANYCQSFGIDVTTNIDYYTTTDYQHP